MKIYFSSVLALLVVEGAGAFAPSNNWAPRQPTFRLYNAQTMVKDATFSTGSDVSIPYDAAAQLAYDEWRGQFKKGSYDAKRFEVFKANYETVTIANVAAKKKARDEGTSSLTLMSLNEYADLTEEEFRNMMASGSTKMSTGDVLIRAVENAELQSEASSALGEAADALFEEEKKLAESLGLKSVDELEVALDSMQGIAADGGELDSQNLSREARIRDAYLKWCKEFSKKPDESRFPTFSNNYLLMEQYAKETNKEMNLNQYADCTKEEYEALLGQKAKEQAEREAERARIEKIKSEAKEREAALKEQQRIVEEKDAIEAAKEREMRAKQLAERTKMEAERRKQIEQERAERMKQQEAALAKQKAELETSVIAAAKVDAERQAKLVAQRAKFEAEAAEKARREAREWEEKQRILASGGKLTKKEPPKKASFLASFFSAPSGEVKLVPKKAPAVKAPAPASGFSFLSTPAPKKAAPAPSFSFFSDSASAPKKASAPTPAPVMEVKKAAPAPSFSFFAAPPPSKASQVPSKSGSLNIAASSPKVLLKVPNRMGSIRLRDTIAASTPKPAPKKDVIVPNRPGTISLKATTPPQAKSSPFSFFGSPAPAAKPKVEATPKPAPPKPAKPSPSLSFFGAPKPAPKLPESAPPKAVAPPPAKKSTPTFSLFGSSGKPAPKVVVPPPAQKSSPTLSLFGSSGKPAPKFVVPPTAQQSSPTLSLFGSSGKTAPKVVAPPTAQKSSPSFSLFGPSTPAKSGSKSIKIASTPAKKAPPKNVPVLSQWKQNPDGSITGKISNSPNFKVGTKITTSPVGKGAKAGSLVKTKSGSQYYLD